MKSLDSSEDDAYVDKSPKSVKNKLSDDDLEHIELMKILRTIYTKFKGKMTWFPEWAIEKAKKNWDQLMKEARVFYSKNDNKHLVKEVVTGREPANIGMQKCYEPWKLQEYFGQEQSYYSTHYEMKGELAPNIAVYTPTYVKYKGNTNTFIHVLNSVGYAFDDKRQPDYKYFMHKPNITQLLIKRYESVFRLMVACARNLKLTKIVVSLVGGDSFAAEYEHPEKPDAEDPRDYFQRTVWAPAFITVYNEALKSYPELEWKFMGAATSTAFAIVKAHIKKAYNKNISDLGFFPALLEDPWVHKKQTLFINAWDPHSVEGNGNEADPSLDGYMGRDTNIAVNGTPMTNPHMQYIAVNV